MVAFALPGMVRTPSLKRKTKASGSNRLSTRPFVRVSEREVDEYIDL